MKFASIKEDVIFAPDVFIVELKKCYSGSIDRTINIAKYFHKDLKINMTEAIELLEGEVQLEGGDKDKGM